MTFTKRRTIAGLAIAFALGLISVGVFLVGEQQRTRIVDQGHQTRAIVTSDHDDEFDHWYTVSYTAQEQNRTADLRYPWVIDKIPVGRALTVYVDADDPELIATADGYSTPLWTSAPGWFAVLAVFAAFISVVDRLTSSRRQKPENG
ncbi:hypothetical protein F4553_001866 [Allocatelliglobosispora scoriae]|uniref:DUF3592 domain-containing protein n=1 Tax=Allocatelliglobosispora scoriae TaxID=643052 RepID=A0A841BHC7_9ACTN|nr:DUF3592 domain-containing protein [Allocatelliglobosispora scoriae]MBB5868487.1 hypothetical protein [Allocatelliglobosispora scoriae]